MSAPAKPRARPRDEALAQLGAAFKGAMAAIRRLRGRDTHRPGELSFAHYQLLSGLTKCDELSAGELAVAADLSPATVTQMLDSLAEMGLVERSRSKRDRRVVTCTLTARGRELLTERHARLEQRWQAALAEFSTQDLATAAAVLDRLRALYDDLSTDAHDESPHAPALHQAGEEPS
jgi:DNA-binding MarR family transcriptional regulator